jgi:hypothetical protein
LTRLHGILSGIIVILSLGWFSPVVVGSDAITLTGPTLYLESDSADEVTNPASCLMYFVPLISPTLVDCLSSDDNQQISKILSFRREEEKEKFRVICEFDIQGTGTFTSTSEPNSMVAFYQPDTKPGKPMKNMLDYIRLEGDGYGWVEVTGRIVRGKPEVKDVRVHFNGKGARSPVTIGLYNIEPRDGRYTYENRSDQIVARVNTLTFRNRPSEDKPTMLVEVASIVGAREKEGFWGNVVGAFANLFIPPVEVDKDGNAAMIEFGYALLKGDNSFTFPHAKNLMIRDEATASQVSAKTTTSVAAGDS